MKILLLFLSALWIVSCHHLHKAVSIDPPVDYKTGISWVDVKNDSAFYYFNKVVNSSNDSLQIATAYTYMAIIQSDRGDYFGAQEDLLNSLKYLKQQEGNTRYLLSDYNELGNTNLKLKNYEAAVNYFDETLRLNSDNNFKSIILNNKAVAYQKELQYDKAIGVYNNLIKENTIDRKEYARILSNIAHTKWLQNPSYNALPDLWSALQIRKEEKDYRGLNASYSHLSDYYVHSRPDSALNYAEKMYSVAQQINNPDNELEALQKLITLGASIDVKRYFRRYEYLSDSLQTARNNAKNQFALVRYEAAKNKADNLVLQKENAEKQIQIILQWGAIVSVLILAITSFIWYKKRKERILREHQLKISQEVHDTVANGIYRIISGVEHSEVLDREELLDQLDIVYEQSRNISYDLTKTPSPDFSTSIAALIKSFSSPSATVSIAGNNKEIWNKIKAIAQKELECVLQELMVNMKKHSAAKNVAVKFEDLGDQIKIQYIDDGIGFPLNFQYGNGLANTENRIAGVGGKIIFDRSITKGLKILIFIPTV